MIAAPEEWLADQSRICSLIVAEIPQATRRGESSLGQMRHQVRGATLCNTRSTPASRCWAVAAGRA